MRENSEEQQTALEDFQARQIRVLNSRQRSIAVAGLGDDENLVFHRGQPERVSCTRPRPCARPDNGRRMGVLGRVDERDARQGPARELVLTLV